jgi:hypothetical protein
MDRTTVRLCIFSFLSVLGFCSYLYLIGFYYEVGFLLANNVYFSLKDDLLAYELYFILFLAVSLLGLSLTSICLMVREYREVIHNV